MKGEPIAEITIYGEISTNHNRENVNFWKEKLSASFSLLPSTLIIGKKLSIEMSFWLNQKRLEANMGNDVDNLVKPVLDTMKRMAIIVDDAFVYQLTATKFPTLGNEQLVMTIREWMP